MAEKKPNKKIAYIGSDKNYWTTICGRFKSSYESIQFDFIQLYQELDEHYHKVYIELLDIKPSIIYIDFSANLKIMLKLAQMITRENAFRNIAMIGLVEEKEHGKRCWSAGVQCIHVKCGEYHDVVYDPALIAFPQSAQQPKFAVGRTLHETDLIADFRLGYISPTEIRAEGNIPLKEGEVISIDSAIPRSIIPSKKFIVKNVRDYDLYYDFSYSYDLEFIYVDEPEEEEDENEDLIGVADEAAKKKMLEKAKKKKRQKQEQYLEEVRIAKKKLKDWVMDNMERSKPKKTKILIADEVMSILRNEMEKPIDSYPYTFRMQTILSNQMQKIATLRPNIIAFQMMDMSIMNQYKAKGGVEGNEELKQENIKAKEEEQEGDADEGKLDTTIKRKSLKTLETIINKVRTIDGYKPFIVIFNAQKYTSETLQETYSYPLIIAYPAQSNLKTLTDMADMLEKKQEAKVESMITQQMDALRKQDPKKYGKITRHDIEEPKYYIDKSNDLSFVSYRYSLTINSITESEVSFLTKDYLGMLETYRLEEPIHMSITTVPEGENDYQVIDGKNQYKAIIHTIGEDDKKTIRKYVNETFFKDINAKREEEQKAFRELNEKKASELKGDGGDEAAEESAE